MRQVLKAYAVFAGGMCAFALTIAGVQLTWPWPVLFVTSGLAVFLFVRSGRLSA